MCVKVIYLPVRRQKILDKRAPPKKDSIFCIKFLSLYSLSNFDLYIKTQGIRCMNEKTYFSKFSF
jgi:hypothetical protein